ncbi:MAG: DNA repair protein RadC [Eubacterium sp.]|nr:DNA repair protein RadC [Eubacterium sp.]
MKHLTIREIPYSERPYEKCENYGPGILSDAELIAVIMRSGTHDMTSVEMAGRILTLSETYPGLMGLYHATVPELMSIPGIGRVKAVQLMCVAELSKRMARMSRVRGRELWTADAVAAYLMEEMRTLETEHLYSVMLDGSSRLIKAEDVFKGTVNMSNVSPREILRLALKYDAASLIVAHNHPSGDPSPSDADFESTWQIFNACNMIGIPLSDHIIIGDNTYVSFSEAGMLENSEYRISKEYNLQNKEQTERIVKCHQKQ